VACRGVTAIGVATITALRTVQPIRAILAGELTLLPAPPGCARAGPVLGVAGSPVETLAGQVTAKAPSAAGAADGAVHPVPACLASTRPIYR